MNRVTRWTIAATLIGSGCASETADDGAARYRGQPLDFWIESAGAQTAAKADSEEFGAACITRVDALVAFAPHEIRAREELRSLLGDRSDAVRDITISGLEEVPASVRGYLAPTIVAQLSDRSRLEPALGLLIKWDLRLGDGDALRTALASRQPPATLERCAGGDEFNPFASAALEILEDLGESEEDHELVRGDAEWQRRWSLAHALAKAGVVESRWQRVHELECAVQVVAASDAAADAPFEARLVAALDRAAATPTVNSRVDLIGASRGLPSRLRPPMVETLVSVLAEADAAEAALELLLEWGATGTSIERFTEALVTPQHGLATRLAGPLTEAAWEIVKKEEQVPARYEFGHLLAAAAVALGERGDAQALDTLALSLFRVGRVDEALAVQVEAIEKLAPGQQAKAIDFETRLQRYRVGH